MPTTIHELFDSRSGTEGPSSDRNLRYAILGTEDDAEVDALILLTKPATHAGLVYDSFEKDTVGGGVWFAEVKYQDQQAVSKPQTGDNVFSFDTAGGTRHITQSLETIAKYPAGTAPDFKGALNVTGDSVEGVDLEDSIFAFTIERYVADANLSQSYIQNLYDAGSTTNNAPWKVQIKGKLFNFKRGEAIYKNAAGSLRGDDEWQLSLRFAAQKNRTNFSIGAITGISKKGWEYLWVRYQDTEDQNVLIKQPQAVYVERMHEESDFTRIIGSLGDA